MREQPNRPLLEAEDSDESVWEQARREAKTFGLIRIAAYVGATLVVIIVCGSVAVSSTERERPGVRSAALVIMGLFVVGLALAACGRVRSGQIAFEERAAKRLSATLPLTSPQPSSSSSSSRAHSPRAACRLCGDALVDRQSARRGICRPCHDSERINERNDIDMAVAISLSVQQSEDGQAATRAKPRQKSAPQQSDEDADLVAALQASYQDSTTRV
eukprot:TRINITY_DN8635_c0_g1_i1.p1 TRINITY_DN8635_c0_g1~~TRINITY_DN8635_c0_g1_i1.p1  ORF type:complete len:217 (-),score=48.36 TRINITY_DN8635_c0_g1_i1:143-793(-)